MAIIPQMNLFSWKDIEDLGDLRRLKLVIEYLPDEELMIALEKQRKNGRNDYPIRAIWNTILAGIVFEHRSIESLRRELSRNAQLDRKSTRLNSSHVAISYAVFCLKKKNKKI